MSKIRQLGLAFGLALPLIFGGIQVFAFSLTDVPSGPGGSSSFVDPDAQFDVMSDQMSQMYDTAPTDYSDLFSSDNETHENAGSPGTPRAPVNIGGRH